MTVSIYWNHLLNGRTSRFLVVQDFSIQVFASLHAIALPEVNRAFPLESRSSLEIDTNTTTPLNGSRPLRLEGDEEALLHHQPRTQKLPRRR